jgi:hypothetical protein
MPASEDHSIEALDWTLPEGARVPEGCTFFEGEDDGYCRVIHEGDRGRCQGVRMIATGLCPPHSGRSKILDDPRGMQNRGAGAKVRARERRQLLERNGINPRSAAREAAIARTDAVVRALVDEPLDDRSVGTRARQRAVLDMLDAVFPLSHAEISVELPADPEGMGWAEMQALARALAE